MLIVPSGGILPEEVFGISDIFGENLTYQETIFDVEGCIFDMSYKEKCPS